MKHTTSCEAVAVSSRTVASRWGSWLICKANAGEVSVSALPCPRAPHPGSCAKNNEAHKVEREPHWQVLPPLEPLPIIPPPIDELKVDGVDSRLAALHQSRYPRVLPFSLGPQRIVPESDRARSGQTR